MGQSRCYNFMKYLVIILNVFFLVVSLVVVCGAGWALWALRGEQAARGGAARAGLAAAAAWGAALLAGAAAALAAAARRGAGAALLAALLLAACWAAATAAVCWAAQHTPDLKDALHQRLRHAVLVEYGSGGPQTALLDALQSGLRCCGAGGAGDWPASAWAAGSAPRPLDLSVSAPAVAVSLPPTCCQPESPTCSLDPTAASHADVSLAGCSARAWAALAGSARAPLVACGAAHAALALTAALTLALAATLHRRRLHYKA